MPMPPELQDDGDDFTFPTPPQPRLFSIHHQSSPPVCLLSSPIRRSFSAADCAASPWRNARLVLRRRGGGGVCSPALSNYSAAAGFFDDEDDEQEEEEERMDSLWEDLNDEDGSAGKRDLFLNSLDVSGRRFVGGPDLADKRKPASKDSEGAMLGSSKSSRRRPPGLVAMMRSLKKLLVAHKGKNKTATCSNSGKK